MNPKAFVVDHRHAPFDVYVGRPSIWGNPYSHKSGTLARFRTASRVEAVRKYREYILGRPDLMAKLPELKGKKLGCWCFPKLCHAEVLAELANRDMYVMQVLETRYVELHGPIEGGYSAHVDILCQECGTVAYLADPSEYELCPGCGNEAHLPSIWEDWIPF